MTVVLHQFGPKLSEQLRERFDDDVEPVEIPHREPVPDGVKGEVLFPAFGDLPVFAQLPELGVAWVQLPATGIDAYPLPRFHDVTLTCARGLSAVPISEFVLASMLAFEKHLPDVWAHEKPETWNWAELGGLAGRTLALIGLGGIGTAVARRALAFDMRVVALRRHPEAGSPIEGVDVVASLDELLPAADHLVVAAPATARTTHLLDADAFSKVKPGVHLVNIARGTLVDQDALRAALDDDRVARASLDVADPEPLPEGHWLYTHPSVRVTPHISWSAPGQVDQIREYFLANLARWLRGEPLEGLVDLHEGY